MSGSKILIVDDEPHMIFLTKLALEDPELEIRSASSGEECLKLIKGGERPDMMLLDIMMPGMSGYDVCRQVKSSEETKNIKVVYYSALPENEIIKHMERTCADNFIVKSLPMDELKPLVKKMLRSQ